MTIDLLDALGLGHPHWDINAMNRACPGGWGLGWFDGGKGSWRDSFGDPVNNVKQSFDTGKWIVGRVQMWWSKDHSFAPLENLKRRLPIYQKLAEAYPHIPIWVSPSCEYYEKSVKKLQDAVKLIQQLAPSCHPVLTPGKGYPTLPLVPVERHGKQPAQYCSWDGNAMYDYDVEAWKRATVGGAYRGYWGFRLNCSEVTEDAHGNPIYVPPYKRTALPDQNYLTSLFYLARDAGTPPAQGALIPVKDPLIWKTHAEDMEGNGPRDNRPVFMVPTFADKAEVFDSAGHRIAVFPRWPQDGAGVKLKRYYSGLGPRLYGWQLAETAIASSGSPWVNVLVGGKRYGWIHPALRAGRMGA